MNHTADKGTPAPDPQPLATTEPGGMGGLSLREELVLQQLLQTQFWANRSRPTVSGESSETVGARPPANEAALGSWELTRGISLHDWQIECVEAWFRAGRRGIIKVVTGAGKTILALAIAERLQRERPSLRVAVVVPTIVLLTQWQDEIAGHGNLPSAAVGLIGGGHSDEFSDATRVLICVLNSASKKLAREVDRVGIGNDLLLIVDECHRAGSTEMQKVFETKRAFSLGLSATPERDDEPAEEGPADGDAADGTAGPVDFEDTVLGKELGPVIFELTYADAIRRGVLPPFRIVHYGLSLQPAERERYDKFSRKIKELRDELETGTRKGLALVRWCRSKAAANNPRASQFLALSGERKRLLYRMSERFQAVDAILREAFAQNPETKAILFHESIEEVMAIFAMLRNAGYPVVAEHSEFPDAMRAESLHLFRQGTARIIVSARSLIEGFNVPSADLGIVVAASASVRQRVQTLGRLLRRSRAKDGTEKQARLYVLYAANTTDELIYEKADWEQFVGAERNEYYLWAKVGSTEPTPRSEPPRRPPIDESQVDAGSLVPGGVYPGDSDQGQLYSLDTQGTIRDESGRLVQPYAQAREVLANLQRVGGRFRVTPANRFVTKLEKAPEGWRSIYLGRLDEPLKVVDQPESSGEPTRQFAPGEPYPLHLARGKTFSVLQRDKRLIAEKTRGKVRFVVAADKLSDPTKQTALRQIQQQLANLYANGRRISKITVTEEGHALYVFENQAYFLGHAPEGSEGFVFEQKDRDPI